MQVYETSPKKPRNCNIKLQNSTFTRGKNTTWGEKIGPLVLGSFGIFMDFMKPAGFQHEIRWISWKKQISKCKILKTFITFFSME